MMNTNIFQNVFSGIVVAILLTFLSLTLVSPLTASAEVEKSDITAQEKVVEDKLVITLTEYVTLLQLILIDKLEDQVRELRALQGA